MKSLGLQMSQCCLTLSFRRGSLWLLCHNARNEILQLVSALGHMTQHEAVVTILWDWFGKHGPVGTFVALQWVRVAKGARVVLHQFIFKVIDVVLEAVLLDFFFVSRGSIAICVLKYLDGMGTRFNETYVQCVGSGLSRKEIRISGFNNPGLSWYFIE